MLRDTLRKTDPPQLTGPDQKNNISIVDVSNIQIGFKVLIKSSTEMTIKKIFKLQNLKNTEIQSKFIFR